MAAIADDDAHAGVEKRQLAIAMLQLVEIELGDILERVGGGRKGDARAAIGFAAAIGRGAAIFQRRDGIAMLEAHPMFPAVAPDRQFQPFAERIDHRDAHAVQAAGYLVGIVVVRILELAARMQLGHDDLGCRDAFALVHVHRNAAAIIFHGNGAVGVQLDQHLVAMPGQRLVDRIVGYLEHHMVQARSIVRIADIHAGALAHGVQALEDLDTVCAIGVLVGTGGRGVFGCFAHETDIGGKCALWKANPPSIHS